MKYGFLLSTMYPNDIMPKKNLGNFVHYQIANMFRPSALSGVDKMRKRAYNSLEKMFKLEELNLDLLLTSRILFMNEFKNLMRFKIYESERQNQILGSCYETVNNHLNALETFNETDILLQTKSFIEKSPCSNSSNINPNCKYFCESFATLMRELTKEDILSLAR